MFLQHIRSYIPNCMVLHSRKLNILVYTADTIFILLNDCNVHENSGTGSKQDVLKFQKLRYTSDTS